MKERVNNFEKGQIVFVPAQYWYNKAENHWMDYSENKFQNNIDGMICAYEDLYAMHFPLIKKHCSENDINMLQVDDIRDLLEKQRGGSSDYDVEHDRKINRQIKELFHKKMILVWHLITKAEIYTKFERHDNRPAAVVLDG